MNLGLWRVWKYLPEVKLLAQTYDSITFQIPIGSDREIIPKVLELIKVELIAPNGRKYIVPGSAETGYNWGKLSPANPEGLAKWSAATGETRSRRGLLQRVIS